MIKTDQTTDVVIIGAGAAGIAAAEALYKRNKDFKFKVVEARGKIGGRIKNFAFKAKNEDGEDKVYYVEDGANWIHGQYNLPFCNDDGFDCWEEGRPEFINPVWKWQMDHLGRKEHMKGFFTNYNKETAIHEDGSKVDTDISDKCWEMYDEGTDDDISAGQWCREKVARLWKEYCETGETEEDLKKLEEQDTTMKQCFTDSGKAKLDDLKNKKEKQICKAVEWEMDNFETAILNASMLHNLPLNHHNGKEYNFGDFLITDQRGYSSFLEVIAKGFEKNIMLNKQVKKITYSEKGVTVEIDNGQTITAKYAISTLPLGVMKKNVVTFDPPFSKEKLNAIAGFDMGYYAKIYVTFSENFWGHHEILKYIGEDPVEKSIMTWGLNLDHHKYFPGSNMITFHSMGEPALRIEKQPTDATKEEVNFFMKKMFGKHASDVEEIHVTNWSNDPLTYGSWSAMPLGYSKAQWQLVRQNEKRLYFAGEHTSSSYGFVHTAYQSGKDAAMNILNDMENKPPPSTSFCPNKKSTPERSPTTKASYPMDNSATTKGKHYGVIILAINSFFFHLFDLPNSA